MWGVSKRHCGSYGSAICMRVFVYNSDVMRHFTPQNGARRCLVSLINDAGA